MGSDWGAQGHDSAAESAEELKDPILADMPSGIEAWGIEYCGRVNVTLGWTLCARQHDAQN
jgi:hypothetical protein